MTGCDNQSECQDRCEANRAALRHEIERKMAEQKEDLEGQINLTREALEYDRDELKTWLQRLEKSINQKLNWLIIEVLLGLLGIIAAIYAGGIK